MACLHCNVAFHAHCDKHGICPNAPILQCDDEQDMHNGCSMVYIGKNIAHCSKNPQFLQVMCVPWACCAHVVKTCPHSTSLLAMSISTSRALWRLDGLNRTWFGGHTSLADIPAQWTSGRPADCPVHSSNTPCNNPRPPHTNNTSSVHHTKAACSLWTRSATSERGLLIVEAGGMM